MNTSSTTIEEPDWVSRSAYHIVSALFLLSEIALAVALAKGASLWLIVPLVLVISHLMHGSLVGFHEASHGLLQRHRRFNEVNGVILGTLSFMSFSLYRAAHQTHHANLGTERDEELWPFVHPRIPRWGRVLAAFLELFAGLLFTPFLFQRTFLRKDSPIRQKKVRAADLAGNYFDRGLLDPGRVGGRLLWSGPLFSLDVSGAGDHRREPAKLAQIHRTRRSRWKHA